MIGIRLRRVSKKILLLVAIFLLLFSMIIVIGYSNFINHKNTVIRQQQEHLLTIARSISKSLDVLFNYKTNGLAILAKEPVILEALIMYENKVIYNQHEEIIKNFYQKHIDETESVKLFNTKGELIYESPQRYPVSDTHIDNAVINRVLNNKEGFITKEYLSKSNQFSINIVYPVIKNNEVRGILVNTINLNKIYKNLIQPVQPGKKGYSMLKNREGFIIMHPVVDQVGIESIKVRKERYPHLDWSQLEELNRRQLEEGEGSFIYKSKWWQDSEEKLTKKINSFTTFEKEDISWIISVQMDYKEIEEPIKGTLVNISLIAFIIMIIIVSGLYVIFKIEKRRKSLEIETKYLRELNKTWEELIKSEARLRHSQKLQTIGVLTSGIAHEFNNLLSPILGYSELILENINHTSPIYEDILEINKSALKAKEILKQVLMFSKADASVPEFKFLEVSSIIKESINLIKPILPHNLKIACTINSNEQILGNSTQLQQVLINLYTNSYHAMKMVGGIIQINAEDVYIDNEVSNKLKLHHGKYVKIQVKDNGAGMDENTVKQIFEYFFTTKEAGQGTGLGLGVVRSIVENHGGKIFAQSQLGVGTIMDIYLPAIEKTYDES